MNYLVWREKYGQFNESQHKRDEGGKFSTTGGGDSKEKPKAKKPTAKESAVKVPRAKPPTPKHLRTPKDRTKLTIQQAHEALANLGYKQGKGRTIPVNGKWQTEYEITSPDGKTEWMRVDDVKDIIYGTTKKTPQHVQDQTTVMPAGAVPPVQVPPVQVPPRK